MTIKLLAVALVTASAWTGFAQGKAAEPVECRPVSRIESRTKNKKRDPGLFGDHWWANRFLSRHKLVEGVKGKQVDLVLLGDSIMHFWEWNHPRSWKKLTANRTVLNLGYGGDRTQHVLWRIAHGELDGYDAKCVVLMIGTNNNSSKNTKPENVAAAIEKIVAAIRAKQPKAKIVLHPIFPRGHSAQSVHHADARARNVKTNELLRQFAEKDGRIVWIDFNDKLVDATGWVPKAIMPDQIHPSAAGYDIWMDALAPVLACGGAFGFENPVGKESAPDPFVTWDAQTGFYYLLFTTAKNVEIRRSKTIAALRDGACVTVYTSSVADGLYGNIWAPEMHKGPNGKWYVYTSGSCTPNDPWGEKRLFVLESKTHDPFDGFVYRGILDPALWAIDPTILKRPDGSWYMCYSRLSRKEQMLVLREMKDPLTLGVRQTVVGRAELKWELVDQRINEGPYFIGSPDARRLFLVYSGNGCWCDDYALGVIEFTGGDPFDGKNWKKHPKPVLYKGNGAFGPGHASFFRSPDGKELWCAYHAFRKTNPARRMVPRYLNFQRVGFDPTGYPVMGAAIGAKPQRPPSGE